jgi:hypothetical protein
VGRGQGAGEAHRPACELTRTQGCVCVCVLLALAQRHCMRTATLPPGHWCRHNCTYYLARWQMHPVRTHCLKVLHVICLPPPPTLATAPPPAHTHTHTHTHTPPHTHPGHCAHAACA